MTFFAFVNASSTSPLSRKRVPLPRTDARSLFLNAADAYAACSPGAQSIVSAARPFIAAHVLSATTARPPHGWNLHGGFADGIATTRLTPGTASAREAS